MFPSAAVDADDADINTATKSSVHQRGNVMQTTWDKLQQAIDQAFQPMNKPLNSGGGNDCAPEELAPLRLSTQRGRPFGQPDWIDQTARRLDLMTTLRRPGRPSVIDASIRDCQ